MSKQTKQKTSSNEESLLNKIKQLEADNFLLSSPQGLTTVGPLPSTSGSNTAPVTATTPAVTTTSVTPAPTTPQLPSSYRTAQGYGYSRSYDANPEERAKAEAQQIEENKKADDYNATLTGRVNALNSSTVPRKSTYDRYGRVIPSTYTPMAPLPVIPKEIEIPKMILGTDAYNENRRESIGNGGLGKPKIDTNIPLFFRDPNGQIRVGWDDYQSGKAEKLSGDPLQIKWNNIEDLRSIRKDWTAKQFENEGTGLQSGWKIKTLKGSNGKKPSVVDASGNFFDIARASALSELAINRPDAVVTKDGKPLNQTSSTQFRLNPNNLFATATVTNEDGTTSKVQYLADKNAYPIIMDGISKALSDNGWKNGEIPKGKFWDNLKSSLKLAYKEPGGEARGGTSRDQFVRAIYSYIMSENQ